MVYVTEFSVVSAMFLIVTGVFYFRQKRIPCMRDTVYTIMLVAIFTAAVFDYITAKMELNAMAWPSPIVYICNMLFLLGQHCCLPAFVYYTLIVTGEIEHTTPKTRRLLLLPFCIIVCLLIASAFSKYGIFFIDENHIYNKGATHIVLYIVAAFYLLYGGALVIKNRNSNSNEKNNNVYFFIALILAASALQIIFPQLLLTSTAAAVSITVIYFILQSPSDNIDPLTGMFNRSALHSIVRDLFQRGKKFTLVFLRIKSYNIINFTFGNSVADRMIVGFASYLKRTYPRSHVVRAGADSFALVFVGEKQNEKMLDEIYKRISCAFSETESELEIAMTSIYSDMINDAQKMIGLMDYIVQNQKTNDDRANMIVDESYLEKYRFSEMIETALTNAISDDNIKVYYQPVVNSQGEVVALEALARVYSGETGLLPTEKVIDIAEQTGSIYRLGEQVLEKVCAFIKSSKQTGIEIPFISMNLSPVQCMQDDMCAFIAEMVDYYGVDTSKLGFEIVENEAMSSMPIVKKNIMRLQELGFQLIMDDFGTGYANFGYLSQLSLLSVKIDRKILWLAMKSKKQKALLLGVKDVLNRLGTDAVCKGVENIDQLEMLRSVGIELFQGFYFSEALPEYDIMRYINNTTAKREQ